MDQGIQENCRQGADSRPGTGIRKAQKRTRQIQQRIMEVNRYGYQHIHLIMLMETKNKKEINISVKSIFSIQSYCSRISAQCFRC